MGQRAFVIRPFGIKKDSAGVPVDFDFVHSALIGPALKNAGLVGSTTGEIIDAGNIREDMFALIVEADLIICDISFHNANVFYELGIRHALRKKRTVLLKGNPVVDPTPFDILTDRYVPYKMNDPAAARADLTAAIKATLVSDAKQTVRYSRCFRICRGRPGGHSGRPDRFWGGRRACQSSKVFRLAAVISFRGRGITLPVDGSPLSGSSPVAIEGL